MKLELKYDINNV